mgnify:CR=1 FL=1
MSLAYLDSAIIVDDVSMFINSIASAAHSCTTLVDEFSFLILLDDWFSISVEVELASHLMRIEVVFLNIEWSRNLTLLIKLLCLKHCLTVQVVNDITSLFINKVATLICHAAIFVSVHTVLVLLR